MTPDQELVLHIIDIENSSAEFGGWLFRSSVMAIVQVESAFRQFARRYEPTINDASYGYMQLLSRTAQDLGYTGPVFPHMPDLTDIQNNTGAVAGTLYDPSTNICLGMRYLRSGWQHLSREFGRQPTLSEWFAGYNEGYGAAARGRPDPAYTSVAIPAFQHWLQALGENPRFDAAGLVY